MAVVKKISELNPKGSNLGTTDLLIVGVSNGVDHDLKTVTGAQVLGSAISQTITNGVTTQVPSSDAVFDALALKADVSPVLPATIIDFDTTDPNTPGTVFTPDDQLNENALYVSSVDFSQWTSDGLLYDTYTPPVTAPSTEWYLAGTTIDAGGNKTAYISRTGGVRTFGNLVLGAKASYLQGVNSAGIQTRFIGINALNVMYIGSIDANVSSINFAINTVNLLTVDNTGLITTKNYKLPLAAPTAGQVLGYSTAGVSDWVANTTFLNARVQSVSSNATVTPVSTNDLVIITAQAVGLTLANPTGTFTEGQALMIRIKDNGTARAIAFDTNYRAIGVTLPTTTVISKTIYLGIIYNSTDSKWDIIGYNIQA